MKLMPRSMCELTLMVAQPATATAAIAVIITFTFRMTRHLSEGLNTRCGPFDICRSCRSSRKCDAMRELNTAAQVRRSIFHRRIACSIVSRMPGISRYSPRTLLSRASSLADLKSITVHGSCVPPVAVPPPLIARTFHRLVVIACRLRRAAPRRSHPRRHPGSPGRGRSTGTERRRQQRQHLVEPFREVIELIRRERLHRDGAMRGR